MTSTAIKPAYRNNDLNSNQDPNQMKTNQSMFIDDAESNKNQSSFSSPVVSPARFHLDESNDSLSRKKLEIEELGVEATELYEKLIFIIYKLIWEGVPGSNEDAWKVNQILVFRFCVFSTSPIIIGTVPNIFKSSSLVQRVLFY